MKIKPFTVFNTQLWLLIFLYKSKNENEMIISFFHNWYICINKKLKCLWNAMPPAATKYEKGIFSAKVTVKVTRSLALVLFERASLVECKCQIWSLYLQRFKSYSKLKLTIGRQTVQKQYAPSTWGTKKMKSVWGTHKSYVHIPVAEALIVKWGCHYSVTTKTVYSANRQMYRLQTTEILIAKGCPAQLYWPSSAVSCLGLEMNILLYIFFSKS